MTGRRSGRQSAALAPREGFTLVEVLVVVAIIVFVVSMLLTGLGKSRRSAETAVCLARQSQLSQAIMTYALDSQRRIPYGPKAPPGSLTNFYPFTGCVTNLISLTSGAPVGLGLMLNKQLSRTPEALFCPGADQPFDTAKQLANWGVTQAQSSYFYRHGSGFDFFAPPTTKHTRIDNLGRNRNNVEIRALAMDSDLVVHPNYNLFGIYSRTHHRRETGNVLYADGHSKTVRIDQDQAYVYLASAPYTALGRILEVLEWADTQ